MTPIARRRSFLVEAAVAAVIIIVLLLVMIPKWQRAQIAGRAAQALKDMAALVQAIEAYNLDVEGWKIMGLGVESQSLTGAPSLRFTGAFLNLQFNEAGEIIGARGNITSIPGTLTSYAPGWNAPIPIPMEVYDLSSRSNVPGRYELADPYFRWNNCDDFLDMLMMARTERWSFASYIRNPHNLKWNCFLGVNHVSGWVGVYHGPNLDLSRELETIDDLRDYYTPFDPTNGLLSHGFAVYESMQPISDNARRSFERYISITRFTDENLDEWYDALVIEEFADVWNRMPGASEEH